MSIFSQLATLLAGKTAKPETNGYRRISAHDARALLNTDAGAKLIDVRTEWEFRRQRIPGSVLIPDMAIKQRVPALLSNSQAPIIVHCQSGVRSRKVAHRLLAMGYTNVYDLGGITSWPYGTVSG